jgi:hypothetical protein
MTIKAPTLSERVTNSFLQLTSVASELNAISDELGNSIADIDAALKKLNVGITVWETISDGSGNPDIGDSTHWSEDIGYAKIKGKWGICLRRVDGDFSDPDRDEVESWLFSDAPRVLRLEAIEKIPDLLEKLSKEAIKVTDQIKDRLTDVREVAVSINPRLSSIKVKFGEAK